MAALVALTVPIPLPTGLSSRIAVLPPLGMLPVEMYTDSNHGIPAVLFLAPLWLMATVATYVVLGVVGRLTQTRGA
jgi:hypothetical protein